MRVPPKTTAGRVKALGAVRASACHGGAGRPGIMGANASARRPAGARPRHWIAGGAPPARGPGAPDPVAPGMAASAAGALRGVSSLLPAALRASPAFPRGAA